MSHSLPVLLAFVCLDSLEPRSNGRGSATEKPTRMAGKIDDRTACKKFGEHGAPDGSNGGPRRPKAI